MTAAQTPLAADGPLPVDAAEPADDRALLARLRDDPGRWIGEVVARHQRALLRHAAGVVGRAADAQDVVQEAFLRLLDERGRVEALGPWLHRVTHNLALDHLRSEGRRRKLHDEATAGPPPLAAPADVALRSRELTAAVERGLSALRPNERAVVLLKVKEGRSYAEIAAMTGLSQGNVGYLIHHGLKKLAAGLRAAGVVGERTR